MDELLQILSRDARIPIPDLAAMTGRTEDEIRTAIAEYERRGTILRYRAVLNPEHVDATDGKVRAWIEVNVTPQRGRGFDAIAERIYRFPEVKSCYLLSGGYDLLLLVECDSLRDVGSFVAEKLATQENVTRTATHFLLKIYKQDGDVFHTTDSSERLPVTP